MRILERIVSQRYLAMYHFVRPDASPPRASRRTGGYRMDLLDRLFWFAQAVVDLAFR
jgi:hypothetical protein